MTLFSTLFTQTIRHGSIQTATRHYDLSYKNMVKARDAYYARRTERNLSTYKSAVAKMSWAKDNLLHAAVM